MTTATTLDQITLRSSHSPPLYGDCCVVELANMIASRSVIVPPDLLRVDRPLEPVPFDDDHPSISRVVRAYAIGLNDSWGDEPRQRLKPYAARILGTATGPAHEETRALLAADWLARVYAPALLRLAGLEEHVNTLAGMERIADASSARAAQPALDSVWKAATAAKVAAWDDAWDADWSVGGARAAAWAVARAAAADAAWDAVVAAAGNAARGAARVGVGDSSGDAAWTVAWAEARDAVGNPVENAVGDAARAAARAAARVAAGNAAWGIAWAAALAAAGNAARDAARAAARDADWAAARDAAADAAWAALRPTVDALQASALALLDAMLEVD